MNAIKQLLHCFVLLASVHSVTLADDYRLHVFDRQQLTNTYFSEGANAGDLNGDGATDVVYGPYWFAGPDYASKHEIYRPVPQDVNGYADNFFSWVYDFNGDGWQDVFVVGFPSTPAYVYENPQGGGFGSHWKKHQVFDWVSNESPQLTNLIGDERPELVCTRDGFFGFATFDSDNPLGTWNFHPISEQVTARKFGHGLGVGDINGDGRLDVIHSGGWYEQPAVNAASSRWRPHEVSFSNAYGGAEMYAYDVDGDGDHDVITSHAAHEFGLGWYEQQRDGDDVTFQHHLIMGSHASENRYGILFSELHSLNLVDIDGDGLKDIVTGKTYWSHHKQSPMWDAGAVVYWFKLIRGADGVDWIPYQVDDQAGIGRQVSVADVNADGLPDIVVGGMKGAHVLRHRALSATREEWQAAQPQLYTGERIPSGENAEATRGPKAKIDAETAAARGAIEGESLPSEATAGEVRTQSMKSFSADRWSDNAQLWWTGGRPGDSLTCELPPFTGTVDLDIVLTCAPDYAIVQLSLDDQELGDPIDLYDSQVVTTGELSFPKVVTQGRKHTLSLQIVGANAAAQKAYMAAVDFVRVKRSDGSIVVAQAAKALSAESEQSENTATPAKVALTDDEYPHAGLSAEAAANAMKVPAGFSITVGAAEPDVQQPIAMAIDDRGRVWIAEAYEYPNRAAGDEGRDRILIFEDTDNNGTLDKRKVFASGLNLVSGLEVGFGGVWVGAAPYLLFIPDKDGDDVPDGKPEVLLDGWGYQDTHETLNAFIWGPDGWLYGCHGVFTHSKVGKPGSTDDQRTPLNAGVWRYHPTKHIFDVFAHGTSNPWGVDFNDHGQAFITACVIPHLFHMVQGGRYQRQGGQHFNPYTYRDIVTIADHLHYLGATPHGGNSKSDAAGGGHAHAGAMIYLGDRWPAQYRNQLFMNNIHGQRLNVDLLSAKGSGYVGSHGPDFLLTGDQASQILNLRYGPDGNAWMIDWYDMQACHLRESTAHDRSNGRVYKISYGATTNQPIIDLRSQTDEELATMVLHANDWYVRHSRRILQERAAVRPLSSKAVAILTDIATTHKKETRRLRAVWTLHVTRNIADSLTHLLLDDPSPYVRGWAIQLAMESATNQPTAELLHRFTTMAKDDESPVVRLYLASAAQLIAPQQRWDLLQNLTAHAVDADDHNLPLLYWYAAEPLATENTDRAVEFAMSAGDSIPLVRDLMLRRVGSIGTEASLQVLVVGLGKANTAESQLVYLEAIRTALKGRRRVKAPAAWGHVLPALLSSGDDEVVLQSTALGITFGDATTIQYMRSRITDAAASDKARAVALQSLLEANDPGLVPVLLELVRSNDSLCQSAIRGLAQYDDTDIPTQLIAAYPKLDPPHKRLVLATLCARLQSGVALLDAIAAKQINGTDLTADLVRQLQFLKNAGVDDRLRRVWGSVRESADDKLKLIARYKEIFATAAEDDVDIALGRAKFAETCQKCHVLYGIGNNIGPDLTGSNRSNLDYLLSNIVDPSAVMAKEYQTTMVLTVDGRVVAGLVKAEDEHSVTIQTPDSEITIPKQEIEQRSESPKSMMPDDQLKQFTTREVRSLIGYLQTTQQSPILASNKNAATIFNRKDLTGWSATEGIWTVENGELVGRTDGLDQNEWIVSDLTVGDFKLTLEMKLVDNAGNSGIQFRSQAHDGEVSGYQADAGAGWWGKLYEEHGRALLWDKSGEAHVKPGDWNRYQIIAKGHHIRTYINGQQCVDLEDPEGATRGIIALQLHSGGKTEVRFRNFKLEVLEGSQR